MSPPPRGDRLLAFFVAVAEELRSLRNFHGLASVVGGLTNSAVDHTGKLRGSWDAQTAEAFAPLRDLVGWKQGVSRATVA